MPNRSGKWSLPAQMQAYGQQKWTQPPAAPTIGTATAGSALCASVTFTAPSFLGNPPASGCSAYQVVSSPGCITASGSGSPITITGLTNGTSYTFTVKSQNAIGFGAPSAASNSVTASNAGCQAYNAGTYCWVAPAGVTSVSVVAIGGGAGGSGKGSCYNNAGGNGGSLSYKNNISVTPGCSYTVVGGAYGAGGVVDYGTDGGDSYFCSTSVLKAPGGRANGAGCNFARVGDGGGNGGLGVQTGTSASGGGGAGGYSGNGGRGGFNASGCKIAPQAGSGGGGGGGGSAGVGAHGGGGTGRNGEGSNGAAGVNCSSAGGGGSGGSNGGTGTSSNRGGAGGAYGGGGGAASGGSGTKRGGNGGVGTVRIVWPGCSRSFPSTCVGT